MPGRASACPGFVRSGSEPEYFVQQLWSNANILQLIQDQSAIHLQVKVDEGRSGNKFPDNVDELYFETYGVIKDMERLKDLCDLFSFVPHAYVPVSLIIFRPGDALSAGGCILRLLEFPFSVKSPRHIHLANRVFHLGRTLC